MSGLEPNSPKSPKSPKSPISPKSRNSAEADVTPRSTASRVGALSLTIGRQIKVTTRTGNSVRACTIVDANDQEIKLHYDGFDEELDHWIPKNSSRILKEGDTTPKETTPRSATGGSERAQEEDGQQDENAEINRQTLDLFRPSRAAIEESQSAWNAFVGRYQSREAAGEAIYQALYEAAPSLQVLFTSSRAVQAMKFMIALQEMVHGMDKPEHLQTFVETLGFQHLHLETTSARVVIFRDAILDVFAFELGDHFTEEAKQGLHALMNYAGGAIIYVRTHYADRLRILTDSWKYCKDKGTAKETGDGDSNDGASNDGAERQRQAAMQQMTTTTTQKGGFADSLKSLFGGGKKSSDAVQMDWQTDENGEHHALAKQQETAKGTNASMPNSFEDMFSVNSAVMGIEMNTWMQEILESFDNLVSNVANSARTKEECDVLALRLSKCEDVAIMNLDEFKACMLAALRSLLPKTWSTAHETAWTWMWENVSRLIKSSIGELAKYEKSLDLYLETLDEAALFDMRKKIYEKVFELAPASQYYFKQSNTRLHFIAERVTKLTLELYQQPKRMVQDISALGLRHVEFGIPTDLFSPFVTASVEVLCAMTTDSDALAAYRWSLGLIATILVRTINEGSTLVMKAINANSIKSLKQAIGGAPRSERAAWLLDIQVGAQSISPLSWSIESGALEVARAIIKDILTIRSDRDTYYFGATLLFERHPDIVHRLVEDAPMLLPTLLEGLIWRSHRTEKGIRRVNYWIKYLLVNEAGEFADALKWLAATGDPQIIAHPVVSIVSDTLWTGVVYRQFVVNKMWNVLSLVVFMLSQGILPRELRARDITEDEMKKLNYAICGGRAFSYLLNMLRLAFFHLSKIWIWCRTTMKRIFDEVDEDGSGSIEWEEFVAACGKFKQTIKEEFFKVFKFLRDDDGPATMEDARKAIASQSKNMYNIISLLLMVLLAVMLSHEPILWCKDHPDAPTQACPEYEESWRYRYSIMSCAALVIHWLILVDLAVFSTEISAFLLVCSHVMGEIKTFMCALTFLLLTFGSAMPIFCIGDNCPPEVIAGNFANMPRAMVSLGAITLAWFEADPVMSVRDKDRMFLAVLFIFVSMSVILLLNLLIAQLNRAYEFIYQDMIGFAKLNRASLIVEAMNNTSKAKWEIFLDKIKLEEKIEFDPGDLGLAGGLQVPEPQNISNVLEEQIIRFGGSTSPEAPWPESILTSSEDQDDRYDRLEQLMMKAYKRMVAVKRGMAGGGQSGSGSGSRTKSSGSSGFSDSDLDESPTKGGKNSPQRQLSPARQLSR